MKVLLDTNVPVAAFLSHGACAELLEHCISSHEMFLPEQVIDEFARTLSGKLKFPGNLLKEAAVFLKENTKAVNAPLLNPPVCRDRDDDAVLAAAIEADVDCIITGDEDLLVLKEYRGVPIIRPAGFWRFESGK